MMSFEAFWRHFYLFTVGIRSLKCQKISKYEHFFTSFSPNLFSPVICWQILTPRQARPAHSSARTCTLRGLGPARQESRTGLKSEPGRAGQTGSALAGGDPCRNFRLFSCGLSVSFRGKFRNGRRPAKMSLSSGFRDWQLKSLGMSQPQKEAPHNLSIEHVKGITTPGLIL